MGFQKRWDTADIASQIRSLSTECASHYNDGFTAFELKKELYLLRDILDHAFSIAPDFGQMEQDWLQEQEKKRIIKHLKS